MGILVLVFFPKQALPQLISTEQRGHELLYLRSGRSGSGHGQLAAPYTCARQKMVISVEEPAGWV